MFSERLSGIYNALEEKHYGLLDFLDAKGIPVYAYNDFLEERGLPAFPVTVAIIVLLIAAIYGIFFVGNTVNPEISIDFSDQFNEGVSGVEVSVKDSSGRTIFGPEKVGNGETITLQGIPLGSELTIVAEKDGYKEARQAIPVNKQSISTAVSMEREITSIVGSLLLIDSETGDPVRAALVTAEWQGTTRSETTDSLGKASFSGIPEGMSVFVTVQADGYNTVTQNYSFYENELKEISLVANSASFAGKSSLLVSIFDEDGNPLEGARAMVLDRATDTSIEERTVSGSEAVFSIGKGTSVRLIAEKEGFLRYDSMDYDESRTMRLDDELWPVVLLQGGTRLVVTVFAGQTPLSDATVQLFDLNGNFVDYDITGFGGTAEFSNLEPKEYFVTGYRQGYLPARDTVNVAGTQAVSIVLEPADSTNSSYVGITVLDAFKAMANGADLTFKERIGEEEFPLGIPAMQTDLSGYASIVAKTGTVVLVEAEKGLQAGFGEKLVEANKDNQVVIELSKPIDVIELQVVDPQGNPVEGNVVIETVEGALLYDGPLSEGRAFFDSEGSKDAIVRVETLEGETFTQRVDLEGKELVKVNLGEAAAGVAPTISFVGAFDSLNQPTEGLVAGEEYWLAFQGSWLSGVDKGGIHVRVGNDGIAFVDSQEVGITGFEATTSKYFYGKSFQPLPAPGSETADKQNAGSPGQMNKFLELYFDQPQNTIAFKVRVKASNVISKNGVEVHFRAWSEAGGKIFRHPEDAELGEQSFVATKTSLYANAETATVKVFSSAAGCEQDLCGNYFFITPDGLYIDRKDFKAVTEETYALEIDLSSKKPLNVTLKLDTDKASPKIMFTGYEVDDFAAVGEAELLPPETDLSGQGYLEWPEGSEALQTTSNPLGFKQGSETSSLTITGLGVSPERSRKVRAYFKGVAEGAAEIRMQAVAETILEESFLFQVQRNKPLRVTVSPREVGVGEAFTVKVMDAEDGMPVENAVVQIRNSEDEIAASIAGRGSSRRGLNGEYYFQNSLGPGLYKVVVSADGFKEEETGLTIARNDLLQVNSPIKIDILKEAREKTVSVSIHNSGKEEVTGLAYEIEKDAGFPEEFAVSVSMPASVGAAQDEAATVRAIVNLNEDSDEDLYGEATLVIHGTAAGNYPTKAEATLQVSYNKPLDEDCLYIDKPQLLVKLIGRAGSTATEEIRIENNCGVALALRPKVEASTEDPNINVTVPQIRVEKDDVQTVKITVSNSIERMYDLQNRRDYKITFESSQIAKTLPLSVEIWNPMTNLSYPPNISLWMVRAAAEELAYAQSPLQVLNNGQFPITSFRAAVSPEAYMQGITTGIKPSDVLGVTLYPNAPLTPQRFVYAQTNKTEVLQQPGQGYIQFYGRVEGKDYPDLGKTILSVNYSGTKCLQASFVESAVFSSSDASQGTLERALRVRNNCGEPVRLSGQTQPKTVGGNTLVVSPPLTINPGQEMEVKLILLKSQETRRTASVKLLGLLVSQNQWIESNELSITLKLGEFVATAEGKATQPISMNICGEEGKIKEVAFPILSEDCGNGYCDAKQLSEYLVEKINTLAEMAEDKINRANKRANNFANCGNQHYCSFDDMGLITDTFPVYLQLDNMTDEVLEKAIDEKGNSEMKGYKVFQGGKSVEDIGSIGFEVGKAYLGGNFKGCGKYYVQVIGAARVENGDFYLEEGQRNFMFSVNIVQDRADTDECQYWVQNVSNFLPVDSGFTSLQHYHAWPGFVKGGSEFGELPKEFAKELFGKAEGRYGSTIAAMSNKLEIIKGDTDGGLLKIRISGTGSPTNPATVYAHVPDSFNKDNAQMASEIAKAFTTFKRVAFSEEDCWGSDETGQYIVMKSYKDIDKLYGKLEIKGESSIRINNQLQCIDLNVTSKVAEKVSFSTDYLDDKGKSKAEGIEYVEIQDRKGNSLLKQSANGGGIKVSERKELQLVKDEAASSPSGDAYKGEFRFCVLGNERFPLALEKLDSISITGYGTATADRKTSPYKVKIEACGMHPTELVKKMAEVSADEIKDKEAHYVTVGWNGKASDTIKLSDLRIALATEVAKERANKEQYVAGQGVPVGEQQVVKSRIANETMGGILFYFGGCTGATAAVNWMVPTKLVTDIVFNCGLNSILAAKRTAKNYGTSANEVIDVIDTFTKPLYPIIAILSLKGGAGTFLQTTAVGMPFFLDSFAEAETDTTLQELEAEKTNFVGQLINSGLIGGNMAKAINLGEHSMWTVTEENSRQLAELAVGQMNLTDDLGLAKKTLTDQLIDNFEKNFKKAASATPGKTVTEVFDDVAGKSVGGVADDIAEEFMENLGKGPGMGTGLSNFKRSEIGKEFTKAAAGATDEALPLGTLSTESFKTRAIQKVGAEPLPQPLRGLEGLGQPPPMPRNYSGTADEYFRSWFDGARQSGKYQQDLLDDYYDLVTKKWKSNYTTTLREVQEESYRKALNSLDDLGVKKTAQIDSMVKKSFGLDNQTSRIKKELLSESDAIRDLRLKKPLQEIIARNSKKQVDVAKTILREADIDDELAKMKKFSDVELKGLSKKQLRDTAGKVKNAFRTSWPTMMKNIGLGIAGSIVAQIGGWAAWDIYWKYVGDKGPGDEGKIVVDGKEFASDRTLLARPIINIDELTNFTTYKVIVNKTSTGRVEFEFIPVKSDNERATKEMADAIKKDPKVEWRGDCKKFALLPAPKILGTCSDSLIPNEGDGITIAMWKAYYDNQETIYSLSKSVNVPQYQIMAVVATDPTEIIPDMPPNWYLYEEDKRNGWLSQTALLIKGKGIDNIYSSSDSKSVLNSKLQAWENTKCEAKLGA